MSFKRKIIVGPTGADEEACTVLVEEACKRLNEYILGGHMLPADARSLIECNRIVAQAVRDVISTRTYCNPKNYFAHCVYKKGGTSVTIIFSMFIQNVMMQLLKKQKSPTKK